MLHTDVVPSVELRRQRWWIWKNHTATRVAVVSNSVNSARYSGTSVMTILDWLVRFGVAVWYTVVGRKHRWCHRCVRALVIVAPSNTVVVSDYSDLVGIDLGSETDIIVQSNVFEEGPDQRLGALPTLAAAMCEGVVVRNDDMVVDIEMVG